MPPQHPLLPNLGETLLTEEQIQARISSLAEEISRDYQGQEIIALSVLKGAALFTTDLLRRLTPTVIVDYLAVSSYGDSTSSTGVVRLLKDADLPLAGRHVLIVEDIIDTGLTLSYLLDMLRLRQPASLKVCCLLDKPSRRRTHVDVDYLGFTIEDRFVVGYGLDFRESYRNLGFIGVMRTGEG